MIAWLRGGKNSGVASNRHVGVELATMLIGVGMRGMVLTITTVWT